MKRLILMLLQLTLASALHAQSTYPANAQYVDNALGSIPPYRGVYVAKDNGEALHVDVAANGTASIAFYAPSGAGAPAWSTATGVYQPADELTRWTSGVIGTMTLGPAVQLPYARCPQCGHRPPTVATPATTLSWSNSRTLMLTAGGVSRVFAAENLDTGSDGDYLSGTWATTIVFKFISTPSNGEFHAHNALSAPLVLTPSPLPVVLAEGAQVYSNYTQAGSSAFTASCGVVLPGGFGQPQEAGMDTLCTAFNNIIRLLLPGAMPGEEMVFWYNKNTNRFGLDFCVPTGQNCVIGLPNAHFDLYLESPEHLEGRGMFMLQTPAPVGTGLGDGELGLAISMTKLPGPSTTE